MRDCLEMVLKKAKERLQHGIYHHRFLLMVLLSILVGIIGGLGAVIFRLMVILNQFLFSIIPTIFGPVFIFLMPTIGGLLAGILISKLGKETKGNGVPEIMEAMALKGGRIRKRVAPLKILVSSITIGSGGSAGREGPIAQIGASSGSTIAQITRLDENNTKILVACGTAAGIAATFNAPFGGLLFGIEVILSMTRLNAKILINMVISVIVANFISILFLGNNPAFIIGQTFAFVNPFEIFLYFLFGVIMGFFGIFWVKFLYFFERKFDSLKIPDYLKSTIGGLGVGLIGIFFSTQVMGVGYPTIELTLIGSIPFWFLLPLSLFKMVVTSLTIGSGGSGGVFASSLFIGATFGGFIGVLFFLGFPGLVSQPMAYALVGMGALFAGVARSPLTCIIMTIEMTSDYLLIIPLMTSCITSYMINAVVMKDENIYTKKLLNRGIRIKYNFYTDIYDDIEVGEIMTRKVVTIGEDVSVADVLKMMEMDKHMGYPVVNDKGEFVGFIAFENVRKAVLQGNQDLLIKDICNRKLIVLFEDDTIHEAMIKMLRHNVVMLPVVDREKPTNLIGLISRFDVMRAHELESMKLQLEKRE
ncbi:MAG: chloride channel protein [Candidatus Helarchaeota archaeon]